LIHVLSALRGKKVQVDRIRSATQFIREKMKMDHPLADLDTRTDCVDIYVEYLGRLTNASSPQTLPPLVTGLDAMIRCVAGELQLRKRRHVGAQPVTVRYPARVLSPACVKRLAACCFLAMLVGACRSPPPPRDEGAAALDRARALAASGDKAGAAESLAKCETHECLEQKGTLAKAALEELPVGPFSNQAAVLRFLRLEELSGASTTCALILATARAPVKSPAADGVQTALVAALGREIEHLKAALQQRELPEVDFNNALGFGSAIADDTDCEALQMVQTRLASASVAAQSPVGDPAPALPGHTAAELGDAAELGLLTAKLERLSAPPKPPVAKNGTTACRDATPLALDESCKTSRGVTISRAKRGTVIGIAVKNRFWSDVLATSFTNYAGGEAESACAALGLRLPSKSDFELLREAFESQLDPAQQQRKFTETGRQDFLGVLPSAAEKVLWSSTRQQGASADALTFLPYDAFFTYVTPDLDHSVSCTGSVR
jgi:hypothetical protein